MSRPTALLLLLSVAAIAAPATVHLVSDGVYDPGDGIHHYEMARYAWRHPELFLNHWGKPLFILLSSPFAQAGYGGAVFFNLLCAALTAWCAGMIARALGSRFAPAAVLLTVFMPLYFAVIVSGLTEPLFALVLIVSVLLMIEQLHAPAALLVSFLPFARTEGFLLLPLFAAVLVVRGRLRVVPLLAAGTLLYSVVGGLHDGDFLWVVHDNPYRGNRLYGRGNLLQFARNFKLILGTAGAMLFLAGGVWTAWRGLARRREHELLTEEVWLVFGVFLTYLAMHSIFWKFGLFSSYGLLRVMAAVSPLGAVGSIIALNGLQKRHHKLAGALAVLAVSCNLYQATRSVLVPFRVAGELIPLEQAAAWIKQHDLNEGLLYCAHPYLTFRLDRDPFDRHRTRHLQALNQGSGHVPVGALVAWDSHFGPAEADIPLDGLLNDPRFELLQSFSESFKDADSGKAGEAPAVFLFRARPG